MNRWTRIAGFVLHLLIGGLMIFAGVMKLSGALESQPEVVAKMSPTVLANLKLIGAGELLAGLLLILPWTTSLGLLATSGFWGGVICTHMLNGESYVEWSVMLVLTWLAGWLRDPRVLASFYGKSSPPIKA